MIYTHAQSRASGLVRIAALIALSTPFCMCGGYDDDWGSKYPAGSAGHDASTPIAADSGRRDAGAGSRGGTTSNASGGSLSSGASGTSSSGRGGALAFADARTPDSAQEANGSDAARNADAVADTGVESAVVRINELNANISKGCDLIELRVLSGGSLRGFELWARTASLLTFGELAVKANDLVVVHLNRDECSPNAQDETLSLTQTNAADAYAGAYDWYSSATGLVNTDMVLTLYDARGKIADAALFSDAALGTAAAASEEQAAAVASSGEWQMIGGGIPSAGLIDDAFNAHAVQDLDATSTTPAGTSLARKNDADSNTRADWSQTTATWGRLNAGQSR
jgi:hypothetical protein